MYLPFQTLAAEPRPLQHHCLWQGAPVHSLGKAPKICEDRLAPDLCVMSLPLTAWTPGRAQRNQNPILLCLRWCPGSTQGTALAKLQYTHGTPRVYENVGMDSGGSSGARDFVSLTATRCDDAGGPDPLWVSRSLGTCLSSFPFLLKSGPQTLQGHTAPIPMNLGFLLKVQPFLLLTFYCPWRTKVEWMNFGSYKARVSQPKDGWILVLRPSQGGLLNTSRAKLQHSQGICSKLHRS